MPPQASFPSPPPSEHGGGGGHHYPQYFDRPPNEQQLGRTSSSLSLNLSSLTVASPTNLSPINPPPSTTSLAPATPISPSTNNNNSFNAHQQHIAQSPFQFDPHQPPSSSGQQSPNTHYNDDHSILNNAPPPPPPSAGGYDPSRRTPGPSRSSSSSSSQLPRKRSFTSNASSTSILVEENMFDEARDTAMEMNGGGAYDDGTSAYGAVGGGGSPVDGSGSTSGAEDVLGAGPNGLVGMQGLGGMAGSMNILGKPMATNNFVTKLYQMINDPKSTHFIAWTDLGTSFVVSNVGEFSRSILGSHFKHNNFSSFVRQLNMYGFHKINRTPRAQRTSTDAQTWEFSHHKFLRGRPDLLDEIKRKALEPDPALKHRVELPGEVAAQLGAMRDENRRLYEQFAAERRKSEKLVNVVGRLWDVVGKGFPGSLPPFPQDILEPESPNIYITSPTSSLPPRLSMSISNPSLHSMHSPNSSPTTVDFPSHIPGHHHAHHAHAHHGGHHQLSRQHSFQHVSFSRDNAFSRGDGAFSRDNSFSSSRDGTSFSREGTFSSRGESTYSRGDSTSSTPLPSSPGEMAMDGMFDDPSEQRSSTKRQRLNSDGGDLNGSSEQLLSSVSSPGSAGPVSLNHNHHHHHNPGTLSIPSASLTHPAGSLTHPPLPPPTIKKSPLLSITTAGVGER